MNEQVLLMVSFTSSSRFYMCCIEFIAGAPMMYFILFIAGAPMMMMAAQSNKGYQGDDANANDQFYNMYQS